LPSVVKIELGEDKAIVLEEDDARRFLDFLTADWPATVVYDDWGRDVLLAKLATGQVLVYAAITGGHEVILLSEAEVALIRARLHEILGESRVVVHG